MSIVDIFKSDLDGEKEEEGITRRVKDTQSKEWVGGAWGARWRSNHQESSKGSLKVERVYSVKF